MVSSIKPRLSRDQPRTFTDVSSNIPKVSLGVQNLSSTLPGVFLRVQYKNKVVLRPAQDIYRCTQQLIPTSKVSIGVHRHRKKKRLCRGTVWTLANVNTERNHLYLRSTPNSPLDLKSPKIDLALIGILYPVLVILAVHIVQMCMMISAVKSLNLHDCFME